jgi:hypothetical protein
MSWLVSAIGKSAAVAERLRGNLAAISYLAAEEDGIKNAVAKLIDQALSDCTPDVVVRVEAFRISIDVVFGFVE